LVPHNNPTISLCLVDVASSTTKITIIQTIRIVPVIQINVKDDSNTNITRLTTTITMQLITFQTHYRSIDVENEQIIMVSFEPNVLSINQQEGGCVNNKSTSNKYYYDVNVTFTIKLRYHQIELHHPIRCHL
jgi:hypothetical protein